MLIRGGKEREFYFVLLSAVAYRWAGTSVLFCTVTYGDVRVGRVDVFCFVLLLTVM